MLPRLDLVLVAHDQYGKSGRLAGFLVELPLEIVLSDASVTSPASAPTAVTRKLLSRSIEPNRRCLILSN